MERTRRICRICPLLIKRFNLVGTPGISDYGNIGNCMNPSVAFSPTGQDYLITWKSLRGGKHENLQLPHKKISVLTVSHKQRMSPSPTDNKATINGTRKRNPPPCGLERSGSTHTSRQNGKVQSQPKYRTTGHQPGTFQRHHHTERNATSRRKQKNQRYAHQIFFEDINYGADGGLYAELVQNRDFEYSSNDIGREENWTATNSWSTDGKAFRLT